MSEVASVRPPTDLRAALHRSPLPIALIDLEDVRILEANAAALRFIGLAPDDPLPGSLDEILAPEDRTASQAALSVLASGAVMAVESRRSLVGADGARFDAHLWVRSLRSIGLHAALVILAPYDGNDPVDLTGEAPATRLDLGGAVAVGSIDVELRILSCSADVVEILGCGPEAVIGETLVGRVHPDDVAPLLLGVGRAVADEHGAAMHVRFLTADDRYTGVRLVVNPIRGTTSPRLGFVMTAESTERGDDARIVDLERHLWRIALEVEAAGVTHGSRRIPDAGTIAGMEELSPRQWEIVTRLLRGERVPDIARALFLSQSTVRNQLGSVYRKLGVHSQSELLALLRGRLDPV